MGGLVSNGDYSRASDRRTGRLERWDASNDDSSGLRQEVSDGRLLVEQLIDELDVKNRRLRLLEEENANLRTRVATMPAAARLLQLEEELGAFKRAKRIADLEVVEARALVKDAELQVERTRQTYSYQLGRALIEGFGSMGSLLHLPGALIRLHRIQRSRTVKSAARIGRSPATRPADQSHEVAVVRERVATLGAAAAAEWVRARALKPQLAARLLIEIAKDIRRTDLPLAVQLGSEAVQLDKSEHRVKWLALVLAESGEVTMPAQLMREVIRAGSQLSGTEQRVAEEIFALQRLLSEPPVLPTARNASGRLIGRVMLLARQCLPFHWSMATLRLHATAHAIRASGREVLIVTLPGYPVFDGDRGADSQMRIVDGIIYHTLPRGVSRIEMSDAFILESSPLLAAFARRHAVDAIQTSADLVTASIGLNVGRALEMPVFLNFDGDQSFPTPPGLRPGDTERAKLSRALQARLLGAADGIALHLPLPAQVVADLANRSHVSLFDGMIMAGTAEPSAGARRSQREHPTLRGRRVFGFLGESTADYDLDLLSEILGLLGAGRLTSGDPALLLAGVGRQLENVRDVAAAAGLGDRLLLLRRPQLADLVTIYAAIDVFVAPLADRPGLLSRTPLEIMLALSHGLPVVVPDLPFTREWENAGLPIIVASGKDAPALALAAGQLLADDRQRKAAAVRALSWSLRHSAPKIAGASLDALYRSIDAPQLAAAS